MLIVRAIVPLPQKDDLHAMKQIRNDMRHEIVARVLFKRGVLTLSPLGVWILAVLSVYGFSMPSCINAEPHKV